MIAVVFFFEDVTANIASGIPEATVERWVYSAKFLGADKLIMIDKTTFRIGQYYRHADSEIEFERFERLEEAEAVHPDAAWVFLENKKALDAAGVSCTRMDKFAHPVGDTIYVVGADSGSHDIVTGREEGIWINIPAPDMWSEAAMAICLYDRRIKEL